MEFFEVLNQRHCTRSFDTQKAPKKEDLEKIVAAGKSAPSAGGIYPVKFYVVRDKKVREKLVQSTAGMAVSRPVMAYVGEPPVILVVTAEVEKTAKVYGERGRELYAVQDAAAAAENIFLATIALGLSTCWIGAFSEEKVQKALGLDINERPMVLFPIGYPKN